jgi:hypothetical protein
VFELVEEALDAISLLVDIPVIIMLETAVALGRDDRSGVGVEDAVVKAVSVVSVIRPLFRQRV